MTAQNIDPRVQRFIDDVRQELDALKEFQRVPKSAYKQLENIEEMAGYANSSARTSEIADLLIALG